MNRIKNVTVLVFAVLFSIGLSFAQDKDMNAEAGKLFNEGNSLLKAGNYTSAIAKYDAATKIEKDYRIFYQKGVSLKKLNKLDEAKDAFEDCLKLNSTFEAAYNALGGVYFSMGNFPAAIDRFEKILGMSGVKNNVKSKVKKNLSLAYAKLGNDDLSKGNSEKGISNLKKAVEYDNYDAAYLSLAKIYQEVGNYDESIKAAESALKHRSSVSKGGPYYYMGLSFKGKGDSVKAKEMFSQAKSDGTYRKTAEYELSILK